ncbi:hypothetical protein LJK87_09185 [Paenibacillus sp. P25]|nr:hypothetical protein LJK87_09185 [Paenibacillus sp. P25]
MHADGKLFFELKNAVILPSENGPTLFFTMTVTNTDSKEISFLDYWVKVRGASDSEFKADLLPTDKLKKTVPSGQSIDYSFYAPVNSSTQLGELQFTVTRWNYDSADLEEEIGDIRFPADGPSVLASAASSRTLQFGGFPVEAEVSKLYVQPKEAFVTPRLLLKLTNRGTSSLKLPGLLYSLRTAGGAYYPLEAVIPEGKQRLNPDVPVELQLTGSKIPPGTQNGDWRLIISQPVALSGDQKLNYPMAALTMPVSTQDTIPLGSPIEYTNTNGTYRLQVEKLTRMPWEDQDILSANLSLTHQEAEALAFPDLKAYFVLDDGVKVEAKEIRTDKAVGIPPGTPVHTELAAKIPYLYPFSSVKLVVQEKTGEQTSADMAQFDLPLSGTHMAVVALGGVQPITGAGRSAVYYPRAVQTYKDDTSKLFEVQMEIINYEKRPSAVPKLAAYLKTPDDRMFPAKLREVKQKLNPSGTALESFTAKAAAGHGHEGAETRDRRSGDGPALQRNRREAGCLFERGGNGASR